jgi:outer membrane immunogenic protein
MRPFSLLLLAVPALAAAPAHAADQTFTGPHVEAVLGWDQTDIGPGLPAREGLGYGVAGGHDWAAGPLRLGVEGEFAGSTVEDMIGGSTQRLGRSFYVGGRLGLPVVRRILVYAKGGYANGKFSGPANYTGDGWRIGGGGELALTERFFLRTEFRYSDYGRRARGQQAVAMLGVRF